MEAKVILLEKIKTDIATFYVRLDSIENSLDKIEVLISALDTRQHESDKLITVIIEQNKMIQQLLREKMNGMVAEQEFKLVNSRITDKEKDIEDLKSSEKWLYRSIVGLFIVAIFDIIRSFGR